MAVSPPNIDDRNAAGVNQQLQQLIRIYAAPPDAGPDWKFTGLGEGLVGVAARFSEIVIQRLNQVPQKNFLAFLNLLGASLLPSQPARVPLTFYLAKGSLADGLVPAGTQVAAPPGPGEKDPIIFETENELMVTAAELQALFTRDPGRDMYADYSAAISSLIATGAPCFHGNHKTEHILYFGDSVLTSSGISALTLTFSLKGSGADAQVVVWEFWDGTKWSAKTPTTDGTKNLQQSGDVIFSSVPPVPATTVWGRSGNWLRCRLITPITTDSNPRSGTTRCSQLPVIRGVGVNAEITASGETPSAAFTNQTPTDLTKDFYPFGERPKFGDAFYVKLDPNFARAGAKLALDATITNPSNGQVIWPPTVQIGRDPTGKTVLALELAWEVWTGHGWDLLGVATPSQAVPFKAVDFSDTTKAFTVNASQSPVRPGTVSFTLPSQPAPLTITGVKGYWVRVRIAAGHYGMEAHWLPTGNRDNPYQFVIESFAPPVLKSLNVDYDFVAVRPPEALLTYNDFLYLDCTGQNNQGSFAPFVAMQDSAPTLYFGFALPAGRSGFLNNPLTLFLRSADLKYGENSVPLSPDISKAAADPSAIADHMILLTNAGTAAASYKFDVIGNRWAIATDPAMQSVFKVNAGGTRQIHVRVTVPPGTAFGDSDSAFMRLLGEDGLPVESASLITYAHEETPPPQQLQIAWEYWNGLEWVATAVKDNTNNFVQDGTVEFLPPVDFAPHGDFGLAQFYWLRARWDKGEFEREPRVSRVLPNTVMGSQTVTLRDEALGSSNGSAGQQFRTAKSPVLNGQALLVREPEIPVDEELKALEREEGADVLTIAYDAVGQPQEIWVLWHEVQDFYASDLRSRHYTLNHLTGEINFGDGINGLIPPTGTGNLKLALYKTGGGAQGNRAAGTIVQLKTTLPYVDKVTNLEAASGGAGAESTDSLIARAPTEIRHRRRAVTLEDYQDLAYLASPDVARALCVPDRDLIADPFDTMPQVPGNVSVIIVPDSTDAKPQPSFTLVQRVEKSLDSSSPANVNVVVVGPVYIRVDVQVEIGLATLEGSGTVVQKVQDLLANFLHPLTGGFDGEGWEFGRAPHRSDLYALLKQIPEADHIRSLSITEVEDALGTRGTGRFLVYSGHHAIQLFYEPA